MEVDFNNLRRQACVAYDNLCRKLNASIDYDGNFNMCAGDIQKEMDELRQLVSVIAMVYEVDDPEKQNVYAELYPKGEKMIEFNPDNA